MMKALAKFRSRSTRLIVPVCLAIGLAGVLFLLEQAFRIFSGLPSWPRAFAMLYLLTYSGIIILGISLGAGLGQIQFLRRASKVIIGGLLLVLIGVAGWVLKGNYHHSWLEAFWGIRLGIVLALIVILAFSLVKISDRFKIIIGLILSLIWIAWAILAPEYLLSWVASSSSEFRLALFNSISLGIGGYLIYRNAGAVPARVAASLALLILIAVMISPMVRPGNKSEPAKAANRVAPPAAGSAQKPNVILIVLDTARKDHLSVYGYPRATSPFLQELSKESLVFTNFKSVASWTLPAHASLFTGLEPHQHQAHERLDSPMARPLGKSFQTLAELLKAAGYRTGAVAANFSYLTPDYGLDQGFDYFHSEYNVRSINLLKMDLMRILMNTGLMARLGNFISWDDPDIYYYRYYRPYPSAGEVNDLALGWLAKNCMGKPCFLFLNYMEAHGPGLPEKSYLGSFGNHSLAISYWGRISYFWHLSNNQFEAALNGTLPISASDQELLNSLYDCQIKYLDHQLESLVRALKEMNLYDNSLIIITADHGQLLGEHHLLLHSSALYEEVLSIPLLIKTPFSRQIGRVEEIGVLTQLFKYLLENVTGSGDYQWKPDPGRIYLAEKFAKRISDQSGRYSPDLLAIYDHQYKIIITDNKTYQVYDLGQDPREKNNLALTRKELIEKYRQFAGEIFKQMQGQGKGKPKLSPEEQNRLRALGYLR